MKKLPLLFAVLFIMGLSACSNSTEKEVTEGYIDGTPVVDATTQPSDDKPTVETSNPTPLMSKFDQTAKPAKGEQIVVMKTSMGTIKLRLFPTMAPKAVENFKGLIAKKYYDGVTFHRVIPGFMIQGGDPQGTGMGGESIWGKVFENETTPQLSHIRGALSMANAGPDTNGSQFFIVQKDSQFLNGGYSIFGQAFEGMDVVDKIVNVKRDANDKPLTPVKMEKVSIETF